MCAGGRREADLVPVECNGELCPGQRGGQQRGVLLQVISGLE